MSRNKYVNDYKLSYYMDKKGRFRKEMQYVGDYFVFTRESGEMKSDSRILTAACAVGWAAFIAALISPTAAMRRIWFSVPFAFIAVPLWLVSTVLFAYYTANEPFVRKTSVLLSGRLKPAAIAFIALAAAALVGFIVAWAVGKDDFTAWDVVPFVSSLLLLACAVTVLIKHKSFPTEPK